LRLARRKAEQLVLSGPFRWRVGEAGNSDAIGEPAFNGGFDEIGRKESQRNRHIDLSRTAVFSRGDGLRTCPRISNEFIQPTTATGNQCNQSCARIVD